MDYTMRHITRLSDYRTMATVSACFFSAIGLSEYRIGEFKKLFDYQISDLGLKLYDYLISDSEKTIGCPPLVNILCVSREYCHNSVVLTPNTWAPYTFQIHSVPLYPISKNSTNRGIQLWLFWQKNIQI